MAEQFHRLPLCARIQFKVLILELKSPLHLAPKHLCHQVLRPLSATSSHPLRSSDRLDLFVPRVRTTMVQSKPFACIVSLSLSLSLCELDILLLYVLPSPLVASPTLSLKLKPAFSLGIIRYGCASEKLML